MIAISKRQKRRKANLYTAREYTVRMTKLAVLTNSTEQTRAFYRLMLEKYNKI